MASKIARSKRSIQPGVAAINENLLWVPKIMNEVMKRRRKKSKSRKSKEKVRPSR